MSEINEAAVRRAIAKILHGMGQPTADGMLKIDPDAVAAELARTVSLRAGDREEAEYDPVKDGQERAKQQIGESRTPDSLAWR